MKPTEEEYKSAKEIVSAYESEQKRLLDIKVEAFKEDLTEYFKDNNLDKHTKVNSFTIQSCWTGNPNRFDIITEPFLDECYNGDNDSDIKKIANKHGVNISLDSGMYSK